MPLAFKRGLQQPAMFFDALRYGLLGPSLSESEVEGCNAILAACKGWTMAWTAYALATAYHETAHSMQPIKEFGGEAYFMRQYDVTGLRPSVARDLGNVKPGDGAKYAGRGYVQLTGRRNYVKAEAETGKPLVDNPDLALDPAIAADIMRRGMAQGWFTGRSLVTYLPTTRTATLAQFTQARKIINGLDKAGQIAAQALEFQTALSLGKWR